MRALNDLIDITGGKLHQPQPPPPLLPPPAIRTKMIVMLTRARRELTISLRGSNTQESCDCHQTLDELSCS